MKRHIGRKRVVEVTDLFNNKADSNFTKTHRADVLSDVEMQLIDQKITQMTEQFGLGDDTGIVAINISKIFIESGYTLDQAELVLEEIKRVYDQLNIIYFICYLHIVAKCPADMMVLMKLTSKILSLDKKSLDRGPKTILKALELITISSLAETEKLIDLMEKVGTEAGIAVMDFQKSFKDSDVLMDLYIAVAETGRIEELSRLENLVNYFRHNRMDPSKELDLIKQMIRTGEAAMAIATLAALEEVYSQPAKLTKLEIN